MSDGSISQDEIDALLSGVGGSGGALAGGAAGEKLSSFKQSALAQFVNGNTPGLASNLESMTGKTVTVSEPVIELTGRDTLLQKVSEMAVATLVDFSGAIEGDHVFVMSPDFAKKIVSLVNHEENTDIDDMGLSVISETVAQYVGAELTALESAGLKGGASEPSESLHVPKAMIRLPQRNFIGITYDIKIDDASYPMWEIISENAANSIVNAIAGPDPAENDNGAQAANTAQGAGGAQTANSMQGTTMQNTGGAGMQGQYMPQGGMQMGMPQTGMGTNVQSVQFPPLQGFSTQEEQGNIGLIMDVYMEMTVELGRTKKMIKEILGMGEGHIIELDKLAGEPVDVLVNHKPIAKGEVVVIEESFGVRITEILSPGERITDI